MNPAIKSKWIAALTSGEYSQGSDRLVERIGSDEYFCVLGVLCDIAAKEGVVKRNDNIFIDGITPASTTLPISVQKWAGIESACGDYRAAGRSYTYDLASHNDNGVSFERLAEIIAENF